MNRKAGVLMPIFSLPSKYGIGCFDQAAYDFVDYLTEAGQTYWQILPLSPTSFGNAGLIPGQGIPRTMHCSQKKEKKKDVSKYGLIRTQGSGDKHQRPEFEFCFWFMV